MEIDNTIFLVLESFTKDLFFKLALEKLWVWENSKIS